MMPGPYPIGPDLSTTDLAELRLLAHNDAKAMRLRTKALGLSLRDRLRLENSLIKSHDEPVAPPPATPPPKPRVKRVCLICTANAFIYDDSPSKLLPAEHQGGNMRLRPTGGLTLTYALVRHLVRAYGADSAAIIALDYVFHNEPPAIKSWEGHSIIRAPAAQMASYLSTLGLLDGWDVTITANLNSKVVTWVNAHLSHGTTLKVAMCHDYSGSPFGPFTHVPRDEQRLLSTALNQWALLCDSQHTADYMERHALREGVALIGCRRCYGATYDYFDVNGEAIPPRLAEAHDANMRYCTIISPCVAKGLSVFLRVTSMLPHIQFAACCTSWTNEVVIGILKKLPNVRVLDSSHRVDDIFEQTKVLLVPSVWPEAFGLVATEACARGIPCVSSKHGGLVEANVLATVDGCDAFGIDTPIFHDHDAVRMRHGTSMEEMEEEKAAAREASGRMAASEAVPVGETPSPEAAKKLIACLIDTASGAEAMPYVEVIERLMSDDLYYALASSKAREAGVAFIREHHGRFGEIVEELWERARPDVS